jgi:hypothetical protein
LNAVKASGQVKKARDALVASVARAKATYERAVKYRDDIKDTQVARTTKERAEQDVLYTKGLWEEEEKALAEMDA